MMDKPILDATCGNKGMWFNKRNQNAVFVDCRAEEHVTHSGKKIAERHIVVAPDLLADFRSLPFPDKKFKLVVFDPPHVQGLSGKSWLGKMYGSLDEGWRTMIHDGFWECMRVLDDFGTLIFKWSEIQIPTREVIETIGVEPLFGHISGRKSNTHWMTFMRFPDEEAPQC